MAQRLTLGRAAARVVARGAAPAIGAASRRGVLPARGTLRVPGLAAKVTVRLDAHGVPQVRARTDEDALFAQGFLHARDRFFQMDMLRRVLRGRLAETVGERRLGDRSVPPFGAQSTTVDADRLVRAFDLVRAARRYLAEAPAEGRLLLDAYVRGVNRALVLLRSRRPLEHRLLRLALLDWTPVDSLLVAKGMALGLSFKWRTAPVFGAMAEHLAGRRTLLDAILPRPPGPGAAGLARLVDRGVEQALVFLPAPLPLRGSNAFLVGAGRSRSGMPLLASDPHLELSLPSIWYLASVSGARYQAVGATLPGLPGVVIGRTRGFAWGVTNGMIDDADLWLEEIDGTGTRYRVDGAWRPLARETHEIRRRGKAPVLFRLRRTHRGPVFTDAFPAYAGAPMSLRMSLHEPGAELEAFLGLGRAGDDGRAAVIAVRGYGAPVQNLVWADARGRAGYVLMGRVPDRAAHPVHPALPRDGTTTAYDWRGWVPREATPDLEIGADATFATANDPQVEDGAGPYLSHLYEPPYRAARIRELLAPLRDATIDDLARIQLDATNGATAWFRDLVLVPHAEEVRRSRPTLGRAIDRLLSWDGREHPGDPGPALWHLAYHHLIRRTFGAALGPELLEAWLGLVNLVDAALRRAFEDPRSPWAPPGARAALLQRALDDAVLDLEARGLGVDAAWGRVHTLTLRHPAGGAPLVGRVFDRGPIPLRGGPFAVASGQYVHTRPARVVTGASYRHVVDLADPERRSRMVTLGGQSGHVGSPHYDDLTPLWLEGAGVPMRLDPFETKDVLVLSP